MTIISKISLMTAVIALVGGTAARRSSAAHVTCHEVHGTIDTAFSGGPCESATGLCTAGTITRAGRLEGTTSYKLDVLAASARPEASSYAGVLTLTTNQGTLTLDDTGMVDFGGGVFTEYQTVVGGTGRFAGATGTLFASGFLTADRTGFGGPISGTLCTSEDDGED
jgi:hypothetical protein